MIYEPTQNDTDRTISYLIDKLPDILHTQLLHYKGNDATDIFMDLIFIRWFS